MPLHSLTANSNLLRRAVFWLGLLALLVAIASTVFTAAVDRTGSDPRATLLTSQSLWQTGSIQLQIGKHDLEKRYSFAVHRKNGHIYGYFPLGSAVLAVPLIAVMNHFGLDVRDQTVDARGQRLMVVGISWLCAGLLVALACLYLSPLWALLVAAVFWFGTSLSSTDASALWSHDFGSVFALLAIYLALRSNERASRVAAFVSGGALFLAYFCRPTLALLAPQLLLYLWFRRRAWVWKCAATLVAGMALLVAFSWHEFHQLLPDYYLPQRLSNREFWTALWANVGGPARGLFVYSPILALPFFFAGSAWKALRSQPWLWLIAVCWPICHWLTISRFPHWWAGFSFGPRLFTDALPGLFVLLCLTMQRARLTHLRLLPVAFATLALPSIAINTYQGLYNRATDAWNALPNIDRNPQLLFDWRYPQFLATRARNAQRLQRFRKHQPLRAPRKHTRHALWSSAEAARRRGGSAADFGL